MTEAEIAQLATFDSRIADRRPAEATTALRVWGIVTMSIGVAPVFAGGVVGLLGGLFGGFYALSVNATWGSVWADVFTAIFTQWIPVWAYVAMAGLLVVGGALVIASIVRDQPRQRAVRELKNERRAFIEAAKAAHRDAPPLVPMTTLMTF